MQVEIVKHGNGSVAVDAGSPQYDADVQAFVRTAATVAAKFANAPTFDKDMFVRTIERAATFRISSSNSDNTGTSSSNSGSVLEIFGHLERLKLLQAFWLA